MLFLTNTQMRLSRLGGVNATAMVVDHFGDQIVKNQKLNVNPALKEWNKTGQLPGLKIHADPLAVPTKPEDPFNTPAKS